MAICKCKMCGGDLNITDLENVVVCDYCGTTQTVPSADSEKKMTLFNRANRLRLNNEFDKAAGIYESIVAEFPEEAEAYWGIVLCKYGIEYVDDPATGKKIPTCHRSSFESVFEDDAFDQACENADAAARRIYRDEAKQIEEIRKGILEVSSKEEPYDIFICYKETDENGDRTIDSVIAQDVYDALTEKSYRVFFSRITLEDKLGQEYEPYIFAALNSAKVMLVFGTDYEYFNAVWVKNEWSRFLQLISAGQKKVLIPCFKGIDAYDMPKEFARLQSQDMGKVGAIQDLLRGIEKLLPRSGAAAQPTPVQTVASVNPAAATVDSLLKRAFMFLEDGNWQSADEYAEKVLDIDPENGKAYFVKLLADIHIRKTEELETVSNSFSNNLLFDKVLRFADADRSDMVKSIAEKVDRRIEFEKEELERKMFTYSQAVEVLRHAKSIEEFEKAAKLFSKSGNYSDAEEKKQHCLNAIETIKNSGVLILFFENNFSDKSCSFGIDKTVIHKGSVNAGEEFKKRLPMGNHQFFVKNGNGYIERTSFFVERNGVVKILLKNGLSRYKFKVESIK